MKIEEMRKQLIRMLEEGQSGELADFIGKRPEARTVLELILEEWAGPHQDEPETRRSTAVGSIALLYEEDGNYLARHCLTGRMGEGASTKEVLDDMMDAVRDYLNFLFEKSRGDTARWRELQPLMELVEEDGGVESFMTGLDRGVSEWLISDRSKDWR